MFMEKFVELIKTKQMKPYHVSKGTGISPRLVNAYSKGEKTPSADNLVKIADYLDCSVDYLLGRTENINSHKLHTERISAIMGQYVFRLNVDENFDVNLSNKEIENIVNMQLNYGWKFIRIEEEKGRRFLLLEWQKEGKPDIDPFKGVGIYANNIVEDQESKLIAAARGTDNSTPTKPNVDNLDGFPTMDEE